MKRLTRSTLIATACIAACGRAPTYHLVVANGRVIDRSTYEDATIPAAGIPYVIVGGQVVVDSGRVTKARPGRAIRAPIRP